MYKDIKAVFIDIDGTIRASNKEITDRTIKSVKAAVEAGVHVVITSGRNYSFVKKISDEAGASPYLICSNGALIINKNTEEIIYHEPMPLESQKLFIEYANNNDYKILFNAGTKRIRNREKKNEIFVDFKKDYSEYNSILVNTEQIVIDLSSHKAVIEAIEYAKDIEGIYISNYSIPTDRGHYINYSNTGVDKANAIIKFCEAFNISIDQTMAIGDGINDISMLNITKHKIAMDNSVEELKNIATHITKSNDEDGVALVLEEIIKSKS